MPYLKPFEREDDVLQSLPGQVLKNEEGLLQQVRLKAIRDQHGSTKCGPPANSSGEPCPKVRQAELVKKHLEAL